MFSSKVLKYEFKTHSIQNFADLNRREFFLFLPFVFAIFWMGIYPEVFLDLMHCSVANIIQQSTFDF